MSGERIRDLSQAVEGREGLFGRLGSEPEDAPLDADLQVLLDHFLLPGYSVRRDRDGFASSLFSEKVELRDLLGQHRGWHQWKPTVTVLNNAIERMRAGAADQYGRVGLLHGLRP